MGSTRVEVAYGSHTGIWTDPTSTDGQSGGDRTEVPECGESQA